MAVANQADATQAPPAMTPPTQPALPTSAPSQVGAAPAMPSPMSPTAPTPTPLQTSQPSLAAAAPAVAPASPTTAPAQPTPGVGVAAINPSSDLRTSSILPTGDTVDRYKLAGDKFNTFAEQTAPQFEAGIRTATQKAAANGAIGSGMLSTDYGNLANQRDLQLQGSRDSFLQNALDGSITDAQNNRNEYRTERGYQDGLENQAYNRGVQGVQLGDQLTNSAFGRGLATSQFGSQGNPSGTELGLAGMYGQQASDAGNSLGQMVQSNASNNILSSIYGQRPPTTPGSQSQTPQYSDQNNLLSSIYGDG